MSEDIKIYLSFKVRQYNRLQANPLKGDELKAFVEYQVKNKTDLLKGWIEEAIAAGL